MRDEASDEESLKSYPKSSYVTLFISAQRLTQNMNP